MDAFDNIIGYDSIKEELRRYCDVIKDYLKYQKLGVKYPKGLLLYGEPGIGKTLMATSFIQEAGIKSYIIQKTETEANICEKIKETFSEAKSNYQSIILLDDIDKFSNTDEEHTNTDAFVTIQSCIDSVKNNCVFVIATANDIYYLPKSLTRSGRFDHIIEMTEPQGEDRIKLIKYFIENLSAVKNIDYEEISKILKGRSAAELEGIMQEAGIYAASKFKTAVEMEDIIRACLRTIYDAPETIKSDKQKDVMKIAFHEAGHAIVSEMLYSESVNLVSVQSYEGSTGGFTSYNWEESYKDSEKALKDKICCLLAGKAAVEMQFGITDFGAKSDIARAHEILERASTKQALFGFDKTDVYCQLTMEKVNSAIGQEMDYQYKRARQILGENLEFLNALAMELVDEKIVDRYRIREMRHQGCFY